MPDPRLTRRKVFTIRPPFPEVILTLKFSAQDIRKIILNQAKRAHVGHIGSALSIADIITALYSGGIQVSAPEDSDRDRFVLSKGHAALALYAALRLRGWLSEDELNTYCCDGSLLGVHPERELRGIDFSTGSLGQGMSMAAGAALAARLQGSARRSFCVMSDAECDEGIVWEAVMFAAHHQLSNFIVIVDVNGQQALGYTRDVLDLSPLAARWRAFGWDTCEVDGHNVTEMKAVLDALDTRSGPPHVLLARTTFGKGVSFMENQIKWHYLPMSDEEYRLAYQEVA
jgi:transketolase